MATDKQTQANRENARHSTGPRTPEGKARAAVNRTTHALTGRHAVLPTESPAAFDQLLADLQDEWSPQTETESQQVELLAHHWWRLLRVARLENDAFTRPLEIRHQLALTDEIDRISRYEARIRRAYHQAIETLRKLQSARRPPRGNSNPISTEPSSAAGPDTLKAPDETIYDPPCCVPPPRRQLPVLADNRLPAPDPADPLRQLLPLPRAR